MRTRSVERTLEELTTASQGHGAEGHEADAHVGQNVCIATGVSEATTGVAATGASIGRADDDVEAISAVRAGRRRRHVRERARVGLGICAVRRRSERIGTADVGIGAQRKSTEEQCRNGDCSCQHFTDHC